MKDSTRRADITPGLDVQIVLKKDQPTGKLTRGLVKDLLTSAPVHPRGIKVRLTSGQVGRVQHIVGEESYNPKNHLDRPNTPDEEDDFDNFI